MGKYYRVFATYLRNTRDSWQKYRVKTRDENAFENPSAVCVRMRKAAVWNLKVTKRTN